MKGFEYQMTDATLFQAIFYSASVPVVVKNQRDSEISQNKKKVNNHKNKTDIFFYQQMLKFTQYMVSHTYTGLLYRGFDQFLIMHA